MYMYPPLPQWHWLMNMEEILWWSTNTLKNPEKLSSQQTIYLNTPLLTQSAIFYLAVCLIFWRFFSSGNSIIPNSLSSWSQCPSLIPKFTTGVKMTHIVSIILALFSITVIAFSWPFRVHSWNLRGEL